MNTEHFTRGLKPIYFFTDLDNFGRPDPHHGFTHHKTLYSTILEYVIEYIIKEPSLIQECEELKAIIITKENMKIFEMANINELYELLDDWNDVMFKGFNEIVTMEDAEIIMDHIQERSYLTFNKAINSYIKATCGEDFRDLVMFWSKYKSMGLNL